MRAFRSRRWATSPPPWARWRTSRLVSIIAEYGLVDAIVIGQTARYFSTVLDPIFLGCSFAFRAGGYGMRRDRDAAIRALIDYRTQHAAKPLSVAEIDLVGFFDGIHHDVVRSALVDAEHRLRAMGSSLDERAVRVIGRYLDAYSFVHARQEVESSLVEVDGVVAWPDDWLAKRWKFTDRIGIAQGGALSNVIANLVLDYVDRCVLTATSKNSGLFYARFADDLLLIHPDGSVAQATFDAVLGALERLGLPMHAPCPARKYGREFWKAKTRAPYVWRRSKSSGSSPWISFLGYDIRYDGVIRIRSASVGREIAKQERLVLHVARALREHPQRRTRRQVEHSVAGHFIRMAIAEGASFVSGFGLLREFPHLESPLRALDRGRERARAFAPTS